MIRNIPKTHLKRNLYLATQEEYARGDILGKDSASGLAICPPMECIANWNTCVFGNTDSLNQYLTLSTLQGIIRKEPLLIISSSQDIFDMTHLSAQKRDYQVEYINLDTKECKDMNELLASYSRLTASSERRLQYAPIIAACILMVNTLGNLGCEQYGIHKDLLSVLLIYTACEADNATQNHKNIMLQCMMHMPKIVEDLEEYHPARIYYEEHLKNIPNENITTSLIYLYILLLSDNLFFCSGLLSVIPLLTGDSSSARPPAIYLTSSDTRAGDFALHLIMETLQGIPASLIKDMAEPKNKPLINIIMDCSSKSLQRAAPVPMLDRSHVIKLTLALNSVEQLVIRYQYQWELILKSFRNILLFGSSSLDTIRDFYSLFPGLELSIPYHTIKKDDCILLMKNLCMQMKQYPLREHPLYYPGADESFRHDRNDNIRYIPGMVCIGHMRNNMDIHFEFLVPIQFTEAHEVMDSTNYLSAMMQRDEDETVINLYKTDISNTHGPAQLLKTIRWKDWSTYKCSIGKEMDCSSGEPCSMKFDDILSLLTDESRFPLESVSFWIEPCFEDPEIRQ